MGRTSRIAGWSPLVGVAAVLLATLTPGAAWSAPEEKVVICHRTNSETNPYNQIAVAESSIISGHGDHVGPIFELGADEWGDIIPPVPDLPNGRNWPEGSSVLDNGCEMQPDVGPLPTATIGDAQCTGTTSSVEVTVSNDPDATQPAFFAILVDGAVVQQVGPVPPGESETVVLEGGVASPLQEDETFAIEVRSEGEIVAAHVVTVDCRGPDPDVDLEAQVVCDGETPVGSATITNNGQAPVAVAATADGAPLVGPVTVAADATETVAVDLSEFEDQTIDVVITVDGSEVATYTVTPDCIAPQPQPRVGVSGSVCPPPLATVTLANDGDADSTVVYGVRVDGELVQESAPIYGGDETTIVADLTAYEDQTVTVALVANGEVLGQRVLQHRLRAAARRRHFSRRRREHAGADRRPGRCAAGSGPAPAGPGAGRGGRPRAARGPASVQAGSLSGSTLTCPAGSTMRWRTSPRLCEIRSRPTSADGT